MMFVFLIFKPVPGAQVSWEANLSAAALVAFFGFLFVTVSSRIVGLIGSSANPISGMTIATLMATSAIFLVKGWTAPSFGALAITIGGVVCIASANAGDTSQDLKTGFLVGATPRKQQIALMIGVCVSTFAIGATLQLMNRGLAEFRQISRPWDISVPHDGVAIEEQHFPQREIRVIHSDKTEDTRPGEWIRAAQCLANSPELADGKYLHNPQTHTIEVQWSRASAVRSGGAAGPPDGHSDQRHSGAQAAVGASAARGLPGDRRRTAWNSFTILRRGRVSSIATTLANFTGGVVRWMADRAAARAAEQTEGEIGPGSLYASGLIAAGGIVGLLG